MQPVDRAIWFIEHRFHGEITLDMIAEAAGLSKYHLVRAFGLISGLSVMRYVRLRRLSEAAKVLAAGADSILQVALDAGYGSHEAFTRAFRDQFGQLPEQVRAARSVENLCLMEPIRMTPQPATSLQPPRLEEGRDMLIAGLKQHYTAGNMAGIPSQWQRMAPYLGNVSGEIAGTRYGVICGGDDEGNIDYMTGVEVRNADDLPREFDTIRIAPQLYAVFTHKGHVSQIGQTWMAIFNQGLAATGRKMMYAPQFELADGRFDPRTGNGEIEIWIPVER